MSPVDRPTHYTFASIEPMDAIVDWRLDFLEGNIVKYIVRWRRKNGLEDLLKAQKYLTRLIAEQSAEPDPDFVVSYGGTG